MPHPAIHTAPLCTPSFPVLTPLPLQRQAEDAIAQYEGVLRQLEDAVGQYEGVAHQLDAERRRIAGLQARRRATAGAGGSGLGRRSCGTRLAGGEKAWRLLP